MNDDNWSQKLQDETRDTLCDPLCLLTEIRMKHRDRDFGYICFEDANRQVYRVRGSRQSEDPTFYSIDKLLEAGWVID